MKVLFDDMTKIAVTLEEDEELSQFFNLTDFDVVKLDDGDYLLYR